MATKGVVHDQEKFELQKASHEHKQHDSRPSQKTAMPRWRSKGKEKSSIALACTWIVNHQISISLNILSAIWFTHLFFPSARHHTTKLFRISYYNPSTDKYAIGWNDIFFVLHWIIVFTGLRCIVMDYVLTPLAGYCGIVKKKARVRFAEQAWILLYDSMFWSTGMYIWYTSDYWLDLQALWRNWPIREMDGLCKWYYLVQFAFWLQQIVVVNIEERRKDHWQMFSHHIVTCILMFTSYGYHQYKVGNVILCLMDIVDIILPAAKLLKYMQFQLSCDIAFGVFMVTWLFSRHLIYMTVLWSIYAHIPQEIKFGCYHGSYQNLQGPIATPSGWGYLARPFTDPQGLVCWSQNISWFFLAMLGALQVILLMWFVMIIRVAYKVITGQGADDTRSDDEDDEDEEDEINEKDGSQIKSARAPQAPVDVKPFIEEEVSTADAKFTTKKQERGVGRTSSRKREGGQSSGINVLGSSDRKELLGRIGCDKPAE